MNHYFLQPRRGCCGDIIDGEEQKTNHGGEERERISEHLHPDETQQEDQKSNESFSGVNIFADNGDVRPL